MTRTLSAALMAAACLTCAARPVLAGAGAMIAGPKFALHAQTHAAKATFVCSTASPNTNNVACSDYVTNWPLKTGTDVYLVLAQGDSTGFSGATFGITYNGIQSQGVDLVGDWTLCASGLQFPSDGWPGADTGNICTFLVPEDCQDTVIGDDGVHAVLGAFYIYAYTEDRFRIREHPKISQGNLATAQCSGKSTTYPPEEYALRTGWVAFGSPSLDPGHNPCTDEVPVEPTTWGRIKSQYRPDR